jgi:hypothetical protein
MYKDFQKVTAKTIYVPEQYIKYGPVDLMFYNYALIQLNLSSNIKMCHSLEI